VVAFELRGGMGNVLTECHVAKCAQGRRVIGVAVSSVSGTGLCSHIAQAEDPFLDETLSSVSSPGRAKPGNKEHMGCMVALHNCTIAMQMSSDVSIMLRKLFLESRIAVALYVVEVESDMAEINLGLVAASSELIRQLPILSAPQLLSDVVDSSTASCIAKVTNLNGLCLYKKAMTRLSSGTMATVFVMPFNRLSPKTEQSDVQFGVLLFEFEESHVSKPSTSSSAPYLNDHCFWYDFSGKLLCASCGMDKVITPPVAVSMPAEVAGSTSWDVAFAVPFTSSVLEGDADALAPKTALAVPRAAVVAEERPQKFTIATPRLQVLTFNSAQASTALGSAQRPSEEHMQAPPAVLAPLTSLPSITKPQHSTRLPADVACSSGISWFSFDTEQ